MRFLIRKVSPFVLIISCFLFLMSNSVLAAERLNLRQHLESFVNSGAEYFNKSANKEQTYKEFSDVHGKFIENGGAYYLFVYNFQGKCLAHGSDPTRYVGKNLLSFKDRFGVQVIKLLIDVAKSGGGFAGYYWPNPKTGKEEFKVAYVKPLGSDILIGSSKNLE